MNDNIIKCRIELFFFYKNTKSLHYAIVFSIKTQVFLRRSKNPSRVLVFEFCLFYKEHHYHLSSRLLSNPLESCRQRWHRISELLHKKQSSQYGNLKTSCLPEGNEEVEMTTIWIRAMMASPMVSKGFRWYQVHCAIIGP